MCASCVRTAPRFTQYVTNASWLKQLKKRKRKPVKGANKRKTREQTKIEKMKKNCSFVGCVDEGDQ